MILLCNQDYILLDTSLGSFELPIICNTQTTGKCHRPAAQEDCTRISVIVTAISVVEMDGSNLKHQENAKKDSNPESFRMYWT